MEASISKEVMRTHTREDTYTTPLTEARLWKEEGRVWEIYKTDKTMGKFNLI